MANTADQSAPTPTLVVLGSGFNRDRLLTGMNRIGSQPFLTPRDHPRQSASDFLELD